MKIERLFLLRTLNIGHKFVTSQLLLSCGAGQPERRNDMYPNRSKVLFSPSAFNHLGDDAADSGKQTRLQRNIWSSVMLSKARRSMEEETTCSKH